MCTKETKRKSKGPMTYSWKTSTALNTKEAKGFKGIDEEWGQHCIWKQGETLFKEEYQMLRQKRMGNKKVSWFNSEKIIGDLLEWSSQQVKLPLSIFLQQSFFLFSLALALSSVALCSCHVWAMINLTKRCQQTPAE